MADWFRWWHGTVNDPKFGVIAQRAKCKVTDVIAIWAYLLEEASQSETRGNVTAVTSNETRNEMCYALQLSNETVTDVVTAMCNRGLIDDGRLCGWERRQPSREDAVNAGSKTNAQRQKEWRERNRNKPQENNAHVTQSNAHVTHQSRAEQNRTDINPLSQAAIEPEPETREQSQPAASDAITGRAIELASMLIKRGAALQASNPLVRAWAARGVTDTQALQALDIANERRAQKANPSPVNAGFLDAILGDVTKPQAAPRRTIHDQRAETIAELTGRSRKNEQTQNAERDITGESVRIA